MIAEVRPAFIYNYVAEMQDNQTPLVQRGRNWIFKDIKEHQE
jgi:hypothetical protein